MKSFVYKIRLIVLVTITSCSTVENDTWKAGASDPDRLHRAMKQITDVIIHDIFHRQWPAGFMGTWVLLPMKP